MTREKTTTAGERTHKPDCNRIRFNKNHMCNCGADREARQLPLIDRLAKALRSISDDTVSQGMEFGGTELEKTNRAEFIESEIRNARNEVNRCIEALLTEDGALETLEAATEEHAALKKVLHAALRFDWEPDCEFQIAVEEAERAVQKAEPDYERIYESAADRAAATKAESAG